MKYNYLNLKNAVLILLAVLLFSSTLTAQKKPTALKLDVDIDDGQLCDTQGKGGIRNSRFCALYRSYDSHINSGNFDAAQADRNEMIEIVRGQVDIFYKLRKDGRSSKIRVFQTILDFLRIGGDLAVTIMNGERAKTIVGAALSGIDTGHTAFDKNFAILQTQVLINKMNTNRAKILAEILASIDKPVRSDTPSNDYPWYRAKNDLRRYLLAGTFDDALDTLVKESGSEAKEAEDNLKTVEKKPIFGALPKGFLPDTRNATQIVNDLETNLTDADPAVRENAFKILQQIVAALLEKGGTIKQFVEAENLGDDPDGAAIVQALVNVRSKLRREADGRALINALDLTIIEVRSKNK